MDKDVLFQLTGTVAPSGREDTVFYRIKQELEPYVDEIHTDVLGNLIAYKKGLKPQSGKLMLSANMDERGVMVIHVEERGFLRIVPIGSWEAWRLVGERVRFANGTIGIIGAEKNAKDVTFTELFIDIGASNEEEALRLVAIGDSAVVDRSPVEIFGDCIMGKALDNRVGCAVVLELVKQLGNLEHDLYIVFSVQKEVGSRGIKMATFRVMPDFALLIGTAAAGDTPGADRSEVKLGKGPAVKIFDGTILVAPKIRHFITHCARQKGIPYQPEVLPQGKSDGGAVQLTCDGIPTGVLSVPLRYSHSSLQMVSRKDMEQTMQLGLEVLRNYGK